MRVSTGKVRLRKAGEVLAFTVPKSVSAALESLVGDSFECDVEDNGDFRIIFTALEKPRQFRIRIGGKSLN